jgi:hypothetical protein
MSQVKDLVDAIDAFIVGCKNDAIWDAIKACCIMAAWDGLTPALLPLKGAAPTNNNFVSGDYNRETGLVGNGSTKYLDSNRNNNADPQNDNHQSIWINTAQTIFSGGAYIGVGTNSIGATHIGANFFEAFVRSRSSVIFNASGKGGMVGFAGVSRNSDTSFTYRFSKSNASVSISSQTPMNANCFVFGRNDGGVVSLPCNGRLSFYSIGESLDLVLLDSRVSTLMTAIGAAIP